MLIADLFRDEPVQWALRGDPYLWREMREKLGAVPCPGTAGELQALLERTFEQLTGKPVSHPEHVYVERYEGIGLSSGWVVPQFWRETAIPLLTQRFARGLRIRRMRTGNALILAGAAAPCAAAALISALVPPGRGWPVSGAPVAWVRVVLGAAIAAIVLGLVLSAQGRRERGTRTWNTVFPPVLGAMAALLYAAILLRLL